MVVRRTLTRAKLSEFVAKLARKGSKNDGNDAEAPIFAHIFVITLHPDELPRFFRALAEETNQTVRDFFLVALLTGARRSNVLEMRWSEVSLERGEWRIPDTKNNTPQTVALSPEVVEILRSRLEGKGEGDVYVFPGTGEVGHLVEPKKGWRRVLERAEIPICASMICGAHSVVGRREPAQASASSAKA